MRHTILSNEMVKWWNGKARVARKLRVGTEKCELKLKWRVACFLLNEWMHFSPNKMVFSSYNSWWCKLQLATFDSKREPTQAFIIVAHKRKANIFQEIYFPLQWEVGNSCIEPTGNPWESHCFGLRYVIPLKRSACTHFSSLHSFFIRILFIRIFRLRTMQIIRISQEYCSGSARHICVSFFGSCLFSNVHNRESHDWRISFFQKACLKLYDS